VIIRDLELVLGNKAEHVRRISVARIIFVNDIVVKPHVTLRRAPCRAADTNGQLSMKRSFESEICAGQIERSVRSK
jgi:hypothetical protein